MSPSVSRVPVWSFDKNRDASRVDGNRPVCVPCRVPDSRRGQPRLLGTRTWDRSQLIVDGAYLHIKTERSHTAVLSQVQATGSLSSTTMVCLLMRKADPRDAALRTGRRLTAEKGVRWQRDRGASVCVLTGERGKRRTQEQRSGRSEGSSSSWRSLVVVLHPRSPPCSPLHRYI